MLDLTVKIGGVDRTGVIYWPSFSIEDNTDEQPNICSFTIKTDEGQTYSPSVNDEVEVLNGETREFFGNILSIKGGIEGKIGTFLISCKDKTNELDRVLVTDSFNSMTVQEIIEYIIDNYTSGITYENVNCPVQVTKVVFNKMSISKCFSELARMTNYIWYIDYYKDIHFYAKSTEVAPISIGEDSDDIIADSIEINKDMSQLRNVVIIRGGEKTAAYARQKYHTGDGKQKTFNTDFKFAQKPEVSQVADSYAYRKKITITGQTGAGTGYQVPLLIGESSGAAGVNAHVNAHCTSFPSAKNTSGDIRFFASDGSTSLPFWVEKVTGTTPNRVAKVWVKVSEDLGTNKDIYIYYGGDATNVSSGDNTFLFFDDFGGAAVDTNKWNAVDLTGISVASDVMTEVNNTGRITSKTTFSAGVEQVVKFKTASKPAGGLMIGGFFLSTSNGIGILNHPGTNARYYRNDANWTGLTGAEITDNVDYLATFKVYASTVAMKMLNYSDLSTVQDYGTITNTVSNEPVALGKRYDDSTNTPGSTSFDFVFVKKNVATEPSFSSVTAEEAAPSAGVSYTVGVENLDSEDDFDCLWDYNQKYVRFKTAPASGIKLVIEGYPLIPIIVQVENLASVGTYGRYEFAKTDKTIQSSEEARLYAEAELDAYGKSVKEGSFRTYTSGLKSGQTISINLPALNIADTFIIQRTTLTMFSRTKGEWMIDLATTKTMGIIQFLQNQLLGDNKKVDYNEDDVLEKYYQDNTDIEVTEEITLKAKINDWQDVEVIEDIQKDPFGPGVKPDFVLSPYLPTSQTDPKREMKLDISSYLY